MISQKIFASVFVYVFACVWYVCVCYSKANVNVTLMKFS